MSILNCQGHKRSIISRALIIIWCDKPHDSSVCDVMTTEHVGLDLFWSVTASLCPGAVVTVLWLILCPALSVWCDFGRKTLAARVLFNTRSHGQVLYFIPTAFCRLSIILCDEALVLWPWNWNINSRYSNIWSHECTLSPLFLESKHCR